MRRFPAPAQTVLALLALLLLSISLPPAGLAQTPQPPALVSPAPGAAVTSLAFEWEPVPEAAQYDVEVWRLQTGTPIEKVWQATTYFTEIAPRDTSAIPLGPISWQVRAVDALDNPGGWSQSTFTYEVHPPALISPAADAALTAGQSLAFEWATAPGARTYRMDVATDAGFENVVWTATTADTSIIPPFPVGTGGLYWRVRGLAPGGDMGPFSATRHLTRTIDVPQNLAGPEDATPTFVWDRVAGAASYNVQVSANSDFSGTPLWEVDTVNNSITPTNVNFGSATRYWRVRARDAGGFVSDWADGGSFSLDSAGGVEILDLIAPEDGAVLTEDPSFHWQPVEGAAGYVLEVSTSASFDALYDRIETNYTAYTPFSNLIQADEERHETYANDTYYWRVRVAGSGRVSEERQFTKAAPITLLAPTEDAFITADPTFRWTPMTGAHHHRLVVSDSANFATLLDTITLGSAGYVPYSDASDEQDTYLNGPHFWKIEAYDANNNLLATSDTDAFTKNLVLDLQGPAHGATLVRTPTFSWTAVAGAHRYRLTVRTGPAFETVYDQVVTDATVYKPFADEDDVGRPFYEDGVYRWQVEALDNLGQSIVASSTRQVTVGETVVTPPATATQTSTPLPTTTLTWTPSATHATTPSATPSQTAPASPIPSVTLTPIATATRTSTPTATLTLSPTTTPTATASWTPSLTPSVTPTEGPTNTPPPTDTPGPTPTVNFIPPSPTPPDEGRKDTDEPNDYWVLAPPVAPGTHQSYVSHERDLDWFKIYVGEPRSVLRISMQHPPADFDLALLRNPVRVGATLPDIGAIADVENVNHSGQLRAPEELNDLGVLQDVRSVRAISAGRGSSSEIVSTNVLHQTGWYFFLVKGYNGAHAALPYELEISIEPPAENRQCTVEPPHPPGVIIAQWKASDTPKTLILVNKRRMDAYYGTGPGPAEQLLAEIRGLAGDSQVEGLIEPVENDSQIADAYAAWDDDACNPEAANRVTEAIKRRINELREVYPTLEHVLIVGNDDIIPFRRVPDEVSIGTEAEYLAQLDVDRDSPFYSALEQGYLFTDDFYVDDQPLAWRSRELYVPDRPVGRLVETPNEIIDAIETFLDTNGALSLNTGLVVGYDFLAGSSDEAADRLRDANIDVNSMIALGWTETDLRNSLLNAHHDVNVINALLSHNEASSPDRGDHPLTAEAVAEVGGLLEKSLFYSSGSHAGLNVPDRWASASDRLDFSQAFSGLGATTVGNTGHGYGLAQAEDYSERLTSYLTEELTQTPDVTIGTALVRAKQRFFREIGPASFSPYHEKALIEASLFGVPSLNVIVPQLAMPSGDSKEVHAGPIEELGEELYRRGIRLVPNFERLDTPLGTFLAADDGTLSQPGRPVQPRFAWNVKEASVDAHGALFTHAEYTELTDFDPLVARPLTDTTRPEPDFPFGTWSPARMQTINRFSTADGLTEQLVIMPGQFKNLHPSSGQPRGIERRYDALSYYVYYSTSSDWSAPTIWKVRYDRTALGAEFWVDVTDPSGIERVAVTYTTGDGEWQTEDLQHVEGFSWQVLMPFFDPDELDFTIQAVDKAGNVAVSVDKGRLFGRRATSTLLPVILR